MSYILAIAGLIAALILWAFVQRWSGETLEAQQDAKSEEGCNSCALATTCSATKTDACDEAAQPPRQTAAARPPR
ncbi:MAG: hypothetical protein CSA66_00675 [Proteobacteria bacterium]|nr:MAG: hypothetical protein CSA66_00675 [Pseudomonadota bacterium]